MKAWRSGMSILGWIAAVALVPAAGSAVEGSLSVELVSAYVFRGSTFNDGPAVQPGLEVAGFGLPAAAGGLSLGVWGNLDLDDYDGAVQDGQFSEIDLYGSYTLPIEAVELAVGYTEYTYPSGGGEADREISVSAELDALLSPSFAAYFGLDGAIADDLYLEAGVGHDVALPGGVTIGLAAAIGYAHPDGGTEGFSHYTASIGISYAMLSAGVTYVGRIDDDVLPDVEDGGGYDVDLVASLGVSFAF